MENIEKKEIAPIPQEQLEKELMEEITGLNIRYPVIKIDHQKNLFLLPSPSGSNEVNEILCVILAQNRFNFYREEQNLMCMSFDGIKSNSEIYCKNCNKNKFGSSGKGKGKLCKNIIRLLLILQNKDIPNTLNIPPTSISSFEKYISLLLSEKIPLISCITKITLRQNVKNNFRWSVLEFSKIGDVDFGKMLLLKQRFYRPIVEEEITEVAKEFEEEENDYYTDYLGVL